MPPKDTVFVEREGAVATVHLNRRVKRNALTIDMWRRLTATVEELDRDTAVKVVVITGVGEAFAAGADIEEFEQAFADPKFGEHVAEATYTAQKRLARNAKPTIAKIRGACVGGGCGIALCCDLRFADPTAKFAITPGKLGLIYSVADTKRLVDTVGPARAKDILFTGRLLDATEAQAIGLIDRLVPAADLDHTIHAYASEIAATSQFSARGTKRIVQMILDGAVDDDRDTRRLFSDAFSGADFKEGVAAFKQKRKPVFPVA
jgi:enoyl-CoA hydratase/carnithine racemase